MEQGKRFLVTGGMGYIGSHTVVQLLNAGAQVVILDNLCHSKRVVLDRIWAITGKHPQFVEGDIRDKVVLQRVFRDFPIDVVIHFAGLKVVSESITQPLQYFDNNVTGSLTLFEEMTRAKVFNLIFSSSAAVYGEASFASYPENASLAPVNVYGRTKLMVENILRDIKAAHSQWRIALLRYFNPVGAHESGLIGESPSGSPSNLMPFITQVAMGQRDKVLVFGGDYPTFDGTGLRDYIHVEDLAAGHLAVLKILHKTERVLTINLGTGHPYSVLEVIAAFEKASGKHVPYQIIARRTGDLAKCYADISLAKQCLGWQSQHNIDRMCQDAWRWQTMNPKGYDDA